MTINSAKTYRVVAAIKGSATIIAECASKASAVEVMNRATTGGVVVVQNATGRTVHTNLARSFSA